MLHNAHLVLIVRNDSVSMLLNEETNKKQLSIINRLSELDQRNDSSKFLDAYAQFAKVSFTVNMS